MLTTTENKLDSFFAHKKLLLAEIAEIIGYKDLDDEIVDYRNSTYSVNGDELYIYDDVDEEDSYAYTISSYSALGEQLFMGEKDGLVFIMSYAEDDSYDTSAVRVFRKSNNKTT